MDDAAYKGLMSSLYDELNQSLVNPTFDAISLEVWGPVIEGVHEEFVAI